MWNIKQIFDGDYGCEELVPGQSPRNEVGEERFVSVEDAWLVERGLDEGSQWPQDTPKDENN